MLRLPATYGLIFPGNGDDDVTYDGQDWLEFFFVRIIGSLVVFIGGYTQLSDIHDHPLPESWYISLAPALIVLVSCIPVFSYLRTI